MKNNEPIRQSLSLKNLKINIVNTAMQIRISTKHITSRLIKTAMITISMLALVSCKQAVPIADKNQAGSQAMSTDAVQRNGVEHIVLMKNENEDGETMVFEPAYIKVNVGDTVIFKNETGYHSVASRLVPEGAASFADAGDLPIQITVDKEGVYLYACPPHEAMGMVGVIQVGNAVNMDAVKKALPELEEVSYTNKGRWEEYAAQIELSD